MADVTSSYRQLCRTFHPDISDDPDAVEQMKQINIAYTVLRDKFKRESAFRERQPYSRPIRRYPTAETRQQATEAHRQHTTDAHRQQTTQEHRQQSTEAHRQQTTDAHRQQTSDTLRQAEETQRQRAAERAAVSADAEKLAYTVLHDYFKALNAFDYSGAYSHLSAHDKKSISLESFIEWRDSVARLYPMREFKIAGGSSIAVVTWGDDKIFHARKFRVIVTEDDYTDKTTQSGDVDKLVINENGKWGVFLGYREISQLTRTFDKRFETKKKREIEKRWNEYNAGLSLEYDMLNMDGMRKSVSRELYRQRRYGGSMTFAAIFVRQNEAKGAGQEELLRSAAKTICGALREPDVPASAGDGVFAVMFIELGKKNAENIIQRLVETIRKNAGPQLGADATIEYGHNSWSGSVYADMDTLNDVLKKFGKTI